MVITVISIYQYMYYYCVYLCNGFPVIFLSSYSQNESDKYKLNGSLKTLEFAFDTWLVG